MATGKIPIRGYHVPAGMPVPAESRRGGCRALKAAADPGTASPLVAAASRGGGEGSRGACWSRDGEASRGACRSTDGEAPAAAAGPAQARREPDGGALGEVTDPR
jgi:hypothetical protein